MPRITRELLRATKSMILVYGGLGVGKTYFCGGALDYEELRPVFYVDTETGYRSIRSRIEEHYDDVEVWSLNSLNEMTHVLPVLFKKSRFKTVVFDSLTEYYALLMAAHMVVTKRDEDSTPTQQDYGIVGNRMMKLIRNIRKLGVTNFVATASAEVREDEMQGTTLITPDIVGKLSRRVPKLFDVVGYLDSELRASSTGEMRRAKRTLQVQPYGRIAAKDRTGSLGMVLNDPTLIEVHRAIVDASIDAVTVEENSHKEEKEIAETDNTVDLDDLFGVTELEVGAQLGKE